MLSYIHEFGYWVMFHREERRVMNSPILVPKIELTTTEIKKNIELLTEFCSEHSWIVKYTSKSREGYYYNGVITLCRERRPEILYYIFLHEIGHAWMLTCDFAYKDKYPELARKPLRYATVTYKIAKVQEEIEAWETGKRLAHSLGMRINESKYEKIRAECLASYMGWAGKPRNRIKKKDKINQESIPIPEHSQE